MSQGVIPPPPGPTGADGAAGPAAAPAPPASAHAGVPHPGVPHPAGTPGAGAQATGAHDTGAHPVGAYPAGAYPAGAYPAGAYPAGVYPWVPPPRGRVGRLLDRLRRAPAWAGPAAVLGCGAAAVAYTLLSSPTAAAGEPPACLLKYTTGFDCPGCGGTRAAWYLLQGDLPAAARHHAVFVFVVPFLLYGYAAWAGRRVFGLRLPALRPGPRTVGWFLGVWLAFSVLRNLPWAPFTAFYV